MEIESIRKFNKYIFFRTVSLFTAKIGRYSCELLSLNGKGPAFV